MALYKCSCGKEKEICIRNVKKGITKSCGCLNKKQVTALGKLKGNRRGSYKHGMFGTRFYNIYYGIRMRCNPNSKCNSKYYSDKSIKCLWKTFEEFKRDMYGSYKSHCKAFSVKQTTIDRVKSSKNYCKSNCKWATYKEQAKEKRGMTKLIYNIHKMKKGGQHA